MNFNILAYAIYLTISALLTVWVARVLFKNGRVFLIDIFHGDDSLADAVNRLLLVGFYLINFGYMVLVMQSDVLPTAQFMLEILSIKIGRILLILGGMHFLNLYIFFKLRHRARQHPLPLTANA